MFSKLVLMACALSMGVTRAPVHTGGSLSLTLDNYQKYSYSDYLNNSILNVCTFDSNDNFVSFNSYFTYDTTDFIDSITLDSPSVNASRDKYVLYAYSSVPNNYLIYQ